jgi:hypothetical protein
LSIPVRKLKLILFYTGNFPFDTPREAGDDVLRHSQQGCQARLQKVYAGMGLFQN